MLLRKYKKKSFFNLLKVVRPNISLSLVSADFDSSSWVIRFTRCVLVIAVPITNLGLFFFQLCVCWIPTALTLYLVYLLCNQPIDDYLSPILLGSPFGPIPGPIRWGKNKQKTSREVPRRLRRHLDFPKIHLMSTCEWWKGISYEIFSSFDSPHGPGHTTAHYHYLSNMFSVISPTQFYLPIPLLSIYLLRESVNFI